MHIEFGTSTHAIAGFGEPGNPSVNPFLKWRNVVMNTFSYSPGRVAPRSTQMETRLNLS